MDQLWRQYYFIKIKEKKKLLPFAITFPLANWADRFLLIKTFQHIKLTCWPLKGEKNVNYIQWPQTQQSKIWLFSFWPHCAPCGISLPWPGIDLGSPALRTQESHHWGSPWTVFIKKSKTKPKLLGQIKTDTGE